MKKRKVLITGVAGFLGSHLADEFRRLGWDVCGVDNLIGGYPENVPAGVEFRAADCNDIAAYAPMLEGVELVYHCAALPHEGLSVFSPHLVNTSNCNASVAVFSAAINARVRRIVYCSSMARYGINGVPFTETMAPKPVDPYGISKVAAEMMLRNLCETHGVEFNIAVPHNIIGPRQKYDDPYRNVASIMINRMLRGLQPIIYGDGQQMRCFSFVADAVFCLVRLGLDPDVVGEVFNIGPDEEFVSINDLVVEIANILDFPLAPIHVRGRPKEVRSANCSSGKARERLGYNTTYTLRRGIVEMVDYIRQRGPREFTYHLPIEIESDLLPDTWREQLI